MSRLRRLVGAFWRFMRVVDIGAAEFTFVPGEKDHYDISLVDGMFR